MFDWVELIFRDGVDKKPTEKVIDIELVSVSRDKGAYFPI